MTNRWKLEVILSCALCVSGNCNFSIKLNWIFFSSFRSIAGRIVLSGRAWKIMWESGGRRKRKTTNCVTLRLLLSFVFHVWWLRWPYSHKVTKKKKFNETYSLARFRFNSKDFYACLLITCWCNVELFQQIWCRSGLWPDAFFVVGRYFYRRTKIN